MKPATLEFVKQRFMEYYRRQNIIVPSSLEQREWGFVFFDTTSDVRMRRHMAFMDPQELEAYVKNLVPAHVYYSTAYYQTPSAPTMSEKHWAGADLIFDLDADQIVRGPYAMMLARV
ncbi:MAG: DNA primase catalytic subunit PriS, partial [Methanoculleus bourgensis]|nr:DNA primase catalytic subunit PriS [Methanoculleus bourgensis]